MPQHKSGHSKQSFLKLQRPVRVPGTGTRSVRTGYRTHEIFSRTRCNYAAETCAAAAVPQLMMDQATMQN